MRRLNSFPIYKEDELKKIRKSCSISAFVLKEIVKALKDGITPMDLEMRARRLIKARNAKPAFMDYGGYGYATCISVNDELVHGIPTTRSIRTGDIVGIDLGVIYEGFYSDCAYTSAVGGTREKDDIRLLSGTSEALADGIKTVRAGAHLGDVEAQIQKTLEANGLAVIRNLSGHGVGKDLHEGVSIRNYGIKNTGPILLEGNVLAIEPMAALGAEKTYIDETGWTVVMKDHRNSAQFEHTVEVTKNGARILTK